MISLAAAVAALALGASVLGEGEVVHLVTVDGRHREHETPLWIVEVDGASWLRSLSGRSEWLARLRERPEVVVLRGSRRDRRLGLVIDDPQARHRVDAAMLEKYGLADRVFLLIARLLGGETLPVRLHAEARGTGAPS